METRARVVVVGSGIAGSSIAYHLAQLGWKDVLVLEQGELVSGTTSHAPGLVGQTRSNTTLMRMLMQSVELYRTLQFEGEPGYLEVGSLRLASSRERFVELRRQLDIAKTVGLPAELISAKDAQKHFSLMSTDGVEGALYLPSDGSARAVVLAKALIEKAKAAGVRFQPKTKVTGFDIRNGRVHGVQTNSGTVETEYVAIASGIWSPLIARLAGVHIPLIPMQHQYMLTEPLEELKSGKVCNLRDPDHLAYIRQDGASLVLGGYEHECVSFDPEGIPDNSNPTVHTFDEPRFASVLSGGIHRVPRFQGAKWIKQINGLESFTPDGEFILGETAEVRGLFVACGFCAHGVSGGGGVGRAIAEWIVAGEPTLDMFAVDVRRFGAHTRSRRFIIERAREVYSTYYGLSTPGHERHSARGVRVSPLYSRLQALGANFGEKAGWERAKWFESNARHAQPGAFPKPIEWALPSWSPAIGVEHLATRERVALFDETSFAKLEVSGKGALAMLQGLCANDLDRAVGAIVYTQMLNTKGGIECDLTVTRLGPERFRLITGTAFGPHDFAWVRTHAPDDGSVEIREVTSEFACIGIFGPKARAVISMVSPDNFSSEAHPFFAARNIVIGSAPVLASRVTYVGELGWELSVPAEFAPQVWDLLMEAGKPFGIVPAGYKAIDSLRLEKGYRYWSAELGPEIDPYSAGLGFAVKLEKGDFIGREALRKIKAAGSSRKLCCLRPVDQSLMVLGGEPIFDGEKIVGRVTSAGYGYSVHHPILYSFLPTELATLEKTFEMQFLGDRHAVRVLSEPVYDPKGLKIRA